VRVDAKSSLALLRGEVTGVTIMASRVRLLDVSVGSSVLQRVAAWCSVVPCVAACCIVLQAVAVCCSVCCHVLQPTGRDDNGLVRAST